MGLEEVRDGRGKRAEEARGKYGEEVPAGLLRYEIF